MSDSKHRDTVRTPPSLAHFNPANWNRPQPAAKGAATADEMYRAVGMFLSSWELLEMALSMLYQIYIESESPAAQRAYGVMASSIGRKDALAHAAQAFFLDEI